jgi:hypothetical protein
VAKDHVQHRTPLASVFHVRAALVGLAAWIIPGLGHALMRRWIAGIVIFASIVALAISGGALHGYVFTRQTAGDFSFLGYLASLGSGIVYFLVRMVMAGADLSRTAGDWGTRLLVTAGVANLVCVLDAVEIALTEEPA